MSAREAIKGVAGLVLIFFVVVGLLWLAGFVGYYAFEVVADGWRSAR